MKTRIPTGVRWSGWSEWTTCTAECIRIRRRSCIGVNFDSTSSPAGSKMLLDAMVVGGAAATAAENGGGGLGGGGTLANGNQATAGATVSGAAGASADKSACTGRDFQTEECRSGNCSSSGSDGKDGECADFIYIYLFAYMCAKSAN